MSELEKEEPGISKEFSLEIEKYAKLEGLSPKEFTQQTIKDRLEKLKKIYPDKPSKMDFLEYDKEFATKAALMWKETDRAQEKICDFLLEKSYELGSYPEGGAIPPTEEQEKKIPYKEYKNIVGTVAKMRAESRRKQDEIDKFVLDFIEKHGVESEENIEALCPSGCGTKLIRHTFFDVFELDMEPSLQNKEEDLYCSKCGIRWIAEQHSPLNTDETENKTQKIELDIPTGEMVLLQQMAKDKGKDTNKMLSEIITEKINQEEPSSLKTENIQLAKAETWVLTLEMVAAQLNESDDISVIKNAIAGDLLVAKISLEYEKTGKVEQEQVKQYVAELF